MRNILFALFLLSVLVFKNHLYSQEDFLEYLEPNWRDTYLTNNEEFKDSRPDTITSFRIYRSAEKDQWVEIKRMKNLRILNCSNWSDDKLIIPDLSKSNPNLEIILINARQLSSLSSWIKSSSIKDVLIEFNYAEEIDNTVKQLKNLTSISGIYLDLGFKKLKSVPESVKSVSSKLKGIIFTGNEELSSLPIWFTTLSHLQFFKIGKDNITELNDDFGNLSNLKYVDLGNEVQWSSLNGLPKSFIKLNNLESLKLGSGKLPEKFNTLTSLKHLEISEPVNDACSKLSGLINLKSGMVLGKNCSKEQAEKILKLLPKGHRFNLIILE